MSKTIKEETYVFHTDLGVVTTTISEVEDYDIEDIAADNAASLAASLQFGAIAKNVDINDPVGERSLKSSYLTEERGYG